MGRSRTQREPPVDYRMLAELRYHIRRFLRAREDAARAVGVLAERLQLRHHTVVELVDRLTARGMVARRRARSDRRQVVVELRPAGEAVLKKLAVYSIEELRSEGPALVRALTRLIGPARRAGARRGRR